MTFNAAENLGTFELTQVRADRTAWSVSERIADDELAELAALSALAKWLNRWQPARLACSARRRSSGRSFPSGSALRSNR
jgi:hypothetical protein